MGAKKFSHTHRSIMCGLKKLASGGFPESWKVLAEQRRQRQRRRRRWKWTKNNKSLCYPGWHNYLTATRFLVPGLPQGNLKGSKFLIFHLDLGSITRMNSDEEGNMYALIRARFLSIARSKLRLCSANHRAGYFSDLACDLLSIIWVYSKQETENEPRPPVCNKILQDVFKPFYYTVCLISGFI